MQKETLRPVYMVYPGLYPLLMFNYWVNRAKVPVVGIMLSGYDTKIKGKILPFYKEVYCFFKRSGWRYSIYMLLIAKLGVQLIALWNIFWRLMGKKIKIKTFEQIAQEKGIPIYRSTEFNGNEALNFLKNVNANIIVSAYNNQILKSRVINFPKYKTINIHPGYLPDFRGLDAVFEALYHKVEKVGVTIHYVDIQIDTGRIILQELLRIRKNDTLFSLNVRLWMHGAQMLQRVFNMIENNNVVSHKQRLDKAKYPYNSYPVKKKINEFIKQGGRIIKFKDLANTFK
jgi:methionyl-tRNA formyltransferase